MNKDELAIFHSSLHRCLADDGFLERFYFLFMASSPGVAEKFKNTNWLRQRRMLVASFYMMMAAEETTGEDTHLTHLAELHGSDRLNIPSSMYDAWLEVLVQAVSEYDPVFDESVEGAWRGMMAKGIARMKEHAGRGSTGRTIPRMPSAQG